jgi:hypothetical protein
MRANNTAAIITAAQRRHALTRAKAIQALRKLDHAGTPITFETIARTAPFTEQGQEFLQLSRQIAASTDIVPAHDRGRRAAAGPDGVGGSCVGSVSGDGQSL